MRSYVKLGLRLSLSRSFSHLSHSVALFLATPLTSLFPSIHAKSQNNRGMLIPLGTLIVPAMLLAILGPLLGSALVFG